MSNITYSEAVKGIGNEFNIRLKMVEYARSNGIKPTAKFFCSSKNTVRKWLRRYTNEGLKGLSSRSNKPISCPHKTPHQEEMIIVALRESLKKISPLRMRYEFEINRSPATIYRIIRQYCKYKPRWKKHRKKNDLRELKSKLKALHNFQIDIKDLSDIPNYWTAMRLFKLPRYQFTARDIKTGALFYSYGHSKDNVNAATFCVYLMEHLKRFGIDTSALSIQTDNDGAFVGNWRPGSSAPFKYIVEEVYKALHKRIPPSAPTYNSDVETSHARIEEEFYDIEEITSKRMFLNKSASYQIYFNLIRPNRYKKMRSPLQMVEEELGPKDPYLLVMKPIILEDYFELFSYTVRGQQLPDSLKIRKNCAMR